MKEVNLLHNSVYIYIWTLIIYTSETGGILYITLIEFPMKLNGEMHLRLKLGYT